MEIKKLKPVECKEWLLYKHYARRMTPINFAFGLISGLKVLGVCTFAIPASRFNLSIQPFELNRLIVNEGLPENTLSKFVSLCLKRMPSPSIIVSYADSNQDHNGYIYQATNWVYTGLSSCEKRVFVDGKELHRRTLYDKFGTSSLVKLKGLGYEITTLKQKGKHRYFYFIGSKKQRRSFKKEITEKYKVLHYPKGKNLKYDAGYEIKNPFTNFTEEDL